MPHFENYQLFLNMSKLRYSNNKSGFVKEASSWAKRNNLKLSDDLIDRMYHDIQTMKSPQNYNFKESYEKITEFWM